jgi:hypothetical protein
MKHFLKMRYSFWLILILTGALSFGVTGCKSKKKLAETQAAEERARMIAKAKADLLAILNDRGDMTLDHKERELTRIKALNIDDAEIRDLIRQVEVHLARERERLANEERERERERARGKAQYQQLDSNFNRIANANNVESANSIINETLGSFSSPEIPVLIIIYRQGTQVDYDEPTTIRKYLHYLKDQKRNINTVDRLAYDNNGKITEIELIRK